MLFSKYRTLKQLILVPKKLLICKIFTLKFVGFVRYKAAAPNRYAVFRLSLPEAENSEV